jgi:hypothetical protein
MHLGEPAERVELPPESVVSVEPGTPLQLRNDGDEEVVVFIYGAPPSRAAPTSSKTRRPRRVLVRIFETVIYGEDIPAMAEFCAVRAVADREQRSEALGNVVCAVRPRLRTRPWPLARAQPRSSRGPAFSKTSSPSRASTRTVSPSAKSPSSSRSASGFSTRRWSARFSGRAP